MLTPDAVLGEARPGRRIVIAGDTAPAETVRVLAEGADVSVHEATFLEDERERAADTLHSTALQAAEVARDASVRLLALTHVSPRYFGPELAREARDGLPGDDRAARLRRRRGAVPRARRAAAREGRRAARPRRAGSRNDLARTATTAAPRRPKCGARPESGYAGGTCQEPSRRTGTRLPSAFTPVTATSFEPTMKSIWIELVLMRSRSASPTEIA